MLQGSSSNDLSHLQLYKTTASHYSQPYMPSDFVKLYLEMDDNLVYTIMCDWICNFSFQCIIVE